MPRSPSNLKALAYAVAVHIVVIALLVVGFTWRQDPAGSKQPEVVKARVVDNEQVQKEVARLRGEEQRKRREDTERQQRLEEAKRKTAETEKKRRVEEQRLAEFKRKQAEEKKRAEAQRVAEDTRRKEAESSLKEQLAMEEKERSAARDKRAVAEAERYKGLIRQKVERSWVRPAAADTGLECVVRVRLVPGGEVIEAKVVRSSGNAAFDRSVENAVYKATPLPLPADQQLFEYFRELQFVFKPEA